MTTFLEVPAHSVDHKFSLYFDYLGSLKRLLQQGISNPEFCGDLVYEFKKIVGNQNFSDLFKRIVNDFKRAGYTALCGRLHA